MAPSLAHGKGTKPQARRGLIIIAALVALGVVVFLRRAHASAPPAADPTALAGIDPLTGLPYGDGSNVFGTVPGGGSGNSGGGGGTTVTPAPYVVPPPARITPHDSGIPNTSLGRSLFSTTTTIQTSQGPMTQDEYGEAARSYNQTHHGAGGIGGGPGFQQSLGLTPHASHHTTQRDPSLGKHNPANPNYVGPSGS